MMTAAFLSSGEASLILSADAVAAARSVFGTLHPQDLRSPVTPAVLRRLRILGAFHWARCQVLPAGQDQLDRQQALLFYRTVQENDPAAVPVPVSHLIAQGRPQRPGGAPPGRPRGPGAEDPAALNARAVALMRRAEADGYAAADEAERLLSRAVSVAAAADPARAEYLSNLGHARHDLFRRDRDPAALGHAIAAHREALAVTRDGDPARPVRHFNLGNVLTDTHEQAALAEGVGHLRAAARTEPAGSRHRRADFLGYLCCALAETFGGTGDQADLDEAIAAGRDAAAAARADGIDQILWGTVLVSLGDALVLRSQLSGEPADLTEGITWLRAAVEQVPPGQGDRPMLLAHLGGALLLSARTDAPGPDALDEAAAALRAAAEAVPDDHHSRPIYLADLGSALLDRYRLRRSPGDLDEALAVLRQAAGTQSRDGTLAQQPGYLLTVAGALSEDAARRGAGAPADEAITMLRAAARAEAAPTAERIQAAREWGDLAAAGNAADAAEGYATAVGLLDLLASGGLRRADQETLLAQFSGVVSDAAAMAVAAGQPGWAVELLEQGRRALLAQVIDGPAPPGDLRRQAPGLADRLGAIRDAIEEPLRGIQAPLTLAAADPRRTGDRRPAAARERVALLAEIRAQPGFAGFLEPPAAAGLLGAAALGPVVIINISRHRCDALALTSDGIRLIELPGLRQREVSQRVTRFLGALDALQSGADGDTAILLGARRIVADTLGWSWDVIAGPVLDGLGISGRPEKGGPWPRIWWCPTGAAAFLQLHAAGRHDTRDAPVPGTVLDRVVSSYTPTARVLLHALQDPGPAAEPGRGRALEAPLIVAMPTTPGATDLPGRQREADHLIAGNPDGRMLAGPEATRGAVLSAIPHSRWIHFACHGVQDRAHPARGRLVLHDGPLTIQEIAGSRSDQGDFAYLSACETLSEGTDQPGEAITLATAVQLAGYRHVVGAQWPATDAIAPEMERLVYAGIRESGPRDTALAVHDAVRALRRKSPDAPAVWAPYVHIGP
jgi:tetratricopeptide (TPR) repeat protein